MAGFVGGYFELVLIGSAKHRQPRDSAPIRTMKGEGGQARLAKCDNEQARAQQQKAGHN
jgi:hypothetical protein